MIDDSTRLEALARTGLMDTDAEEPFDRLTRLARSLIGATASLVSLVDDERQFFKSATGLETEERFARGTPLSHSFCRHVAATGEPLVVGDARSDPLVAGNPGIEALGMVAYAGMPLTTASGHCLGSFCVTDRSPRTWTDEELDILRDLAAAASTEIELRVAVRDAAERTRRDPLTGLLNHGAFHAVLATRFGAGAPLALVLLDIDDFKQVNDRFGHAVGDEVIAQVADRLRAVVRPGDVLGRVGGEEFGLLVPGGDAREALALADRARAAVAASRIPPAGSVRVSAGVCAGDGVTTPVELHRRVDAALRRAKRSGRDRACLFDGLEPADLGPVTREVATPNAVVRIDASAVVHGWNSGAERMFGWSRGEAAGRPITAVVPGTGSPSDLDRLGRGGVHPAVDSTVVLTGVHREGHELTLEVSAARASLTGHHVLVIQDVTARRRAADRLARSEESLRRQAHEQAGLRRVAEHAAAGAAPLELLDMVATEAARLIGAESGTVWRYADDGAELVGAFGPALVEPGTRVPRVEEDALIAAGRTGQVVRTSAFAPDADSRLVRAASDAGLRAGLAAPVRLGGRPWGVIVLASGSRPGFTDDDERRAIGFADLATLALASAEERRGLEDQRDEHAALRRVATAVVADVPREELFALVAREVAELIGVEVGTVVRFEADRAVYVGSFVEDRADDLVVTGGHSISLAGDTALAKVYRSGEPSRVPDYRAVDDRVARHLVEWGYRSSIAAPIRVGGRLWGAVLATTPREEPIPAEAEARLADVAQLLEMAIAGAEAHELVVGETMARIFSAPAHVPATMRLVAETARRTTGADRASLYVLGDGPDLPVTDVHTTESDPERRALLERAIGRNASTMPLWRPTLENEDTLILVPDVRLNDDCPPGLVRRLGVEAMALVKMEGTAVDPGQPRPLTGLLVVSYAEPREFTRRDALALRNLGGTAALALSQARLHERTLQELDEARGRASRDPLTGLLNHRAFHERLASEAERARRYARRLSLAIVDIDHLERVNDERGLEGGDEVVRAVSSLLMRNGRPGDAIGRLSGGRFGWILPECDDLEAWQLAEAVRDAAEPGAGVTVSIGICDLERSREPRELSRLAEGALFWAKEHGRNATFRYTPEVVQVLSAAEQAERLRRDQALSSVRLLARVVDAKDPSTQRHSERVAELSLRLAQELGWDESACDALREAALVHDVGKVVVPDAVLFKPGRLTREEYELIKPHAAVGAQMLEEVMSAEQVAWIRGHHERLDGLGYPDGLSGGDIPVGARILAVADAFDVMTSVRSYSAAMPVEAAVDECRALSGTQFDGEVVAALAEIHVRESLRAEQGAGG